MAFFRSVITTKTSAIAAATLAIPAAFHLYSHSALSFPSLSPIPSSKSLAFSSNSFIGRLAKSGLVKGLENPSSAVVEMDAKTSNENGAASSELLTEFMVNMSCAGCVNSVRTKLQTVEGVSNVEIDLANQVVRVLGTSPVKILTEALEQTGRKARLIGQGVSEDFIVSAAVAEFKGPSIFGVVRLAQANMGLARIEANFSGLEPGEHGWSINEFGDLTEGAASTGNVYNPMEDAKQPPLGDLGTLTVNENGDAFFSGVKEKLRVGDVIGRSIVVYGRSKEETGGTGIGAAVVARSAGVGENYKKLCTCDGTTIWEATNAADFLASKF